MRALRKQQVTAGDTPHTRHYWQTLIAVTLLSATGCSALGRQLFKQPDVALREVRLTGLGFSGGNLDVVLAVYNPNGYRLDATAGTYRVLVDSVQVASGAISDRNAFPGGDTTIVHLPVQFTYAGIGAVARELTQNGALNYNVIGDLTVGSPIGNRTFPFTAKGRLSTINANVH